VPGAAVSVCSNVCCSALLNHLIGAGEDSRREVYAQGLGSLEIEDELEPGYPLDGQILRLVAAQEPVPRPLASMQNNR